MPILLRQYPTSLLTLALVLLPIASNAHSLFIRPHLRYASLRAHHAPPKPTYNPLRRRHTA
jgi:hypothetical protein